MTGFAEKNSNLNFNRKESTDDILSHIVEDVLSAVGESFFIALVKKLANSLQMDFSSVGTIDAGNPNLMHTLAFYANGEIISNVVYDTRNTPCEKVLDTALLLLPARGNGKISKGCTISG